MKKCVFVVLALSVLVACSKKVETTVIAAGDNLTVAATSISTEPQFHSLSVDGMNMEVITLRASDGTNRAAYNTCQVCNGSPLAYFVKRGDKLECQSCKNLFPLDRVGIEFGGCNPIPVLNEGTNDDLIIPYETLKAAKPLFVVWKK